MSTLIRFTLEIEISDDISEGAKCARMQRYLSYMEDYLHQQNEEIYDTEWEEF